MLFIDNLLQINQANITISMISNRQLNLTFFSYCLYNTMYLLDTKPPAVPSSQKKLCLGVKVKVKVTRSMTLVSYEKAS